MLHDSGLPHRFWAEALSTAAYLINQSPTTTLHDMTPFEAWYNKKPNVSHLRVFGCSGFVHIPKDQRKKLDPKAKQCTFLGYGSTKKGYRLYDHARSQPLSTVVTWCLMNHQNNSTGNLWKKMGQPLTNCNTNILNCFLHRKMPSITY